MSDNTIQLKVSLDTNELDKLSKFILLLLIKQAGDLNEQTKNIVNKQYKDIDQDIAEAECDLIASVKGSKHAQDKNLNPSGYQPKHEIKNPIPPPKKP
jgi:hypothetical protein